MRRTIYVVPIAAEGGYVADGSTCLCGECLARRRRDGDFEHHLGPDAAVLLDQGDEASTDPLDVCEDCDQPAEATFVCTRCNRVVPDSLGCDDDQRDVCDDCYEVKP